MSSSWNQRAWIGAVVAWLGLVAWGITLLTRYSLQPGEQGDPPAHWPVHAAFARSTHTHTLVLAAHPRCPCTRATFDELETIMTRCGDRLSVRVLFVQPEDVDEPWVKSDLWHRARRLPGVVAMVDRGGNAARRFGALTSGQVALYDRSGRLVYHGGITGARGHSGPNPGRAAVISEIEQGTQGPSSRPVFGCPLDRPAADSGDSVACLPRRIS